MSRWRIALVFLGITGCNVGPRVADFQPAQGPAGARVTLHVGPRTLHVGAMTVTGELLAVEDTALIVLTSGQGVFVVPYTAIREGRVSQRGATIFRGRTPADRARQRLRLVSRFPQGISPELMEALVAAYGRAELKAVK